MAYRYHSLQTFRRPFRIESHPLAFLAMFAAAVKVYKSGFSFLAAAVFLAVFTGFSSASLTGPGAEGENLQNDPTRTNGFRGKYYPMASILKWRALALWK